MPTANCPECEEEVYVDAESEQGDTVSCDECGAALVVVSTLQLGVANDVTHADAASRVIQGVIAGIGFIGGGVILHADGQNVKGLTTAVTIWVAAALGISCGIGQWRVAGMTAIIALILLVLGRPLEDLLHRVKRDNQPPTA